MFDILLCVGHKHNLWLLLMAGAVNLIGCATALRMFLMGTSQGGGQADRWVIGAGILGGAATWASHFVAMLAYEPGGATGYDGVGTVLSLAIGVSFAVLASLAVSRLTGVQR